MIVAATAGDRTALESLLLRHHDPLLRYLRSLIARQHLHIDAEDALQETFVEAFRRIKTFESRGEAAFDAWLKTVARTRLSNLLKAQRAAKRGGAKQRIIYARRSTDAQTVTTILGLIAGDTPTPSVILRRKEAGEALVHALDCLEPLKQQIMNWRFGQGMSIDSIAGKTGKSGSAIKMIIHRCLQDLRVDLEKNGQITRGV